MKTINISNDREQIYKLAEEIIQSNTPIQITKKKGNVVMVSESDWNSLIETLYLASIPKMKESLIDGMNTPIEDCLEDLNWDTK